MPTYTCELCGKVFPQKGDYTRHKIKKNACVSVGEVVNYVVDDKKYNDDKNRLVRLFKKMLNILRDNEALTGDVALRNMSYLLTLKLIEPKIGKELNMSEMMFYPDDSEERISEIKQCLKFSELVKYTLKSKTDIKDTLESVWNCILSKNIEGIYSNTKTFDIQDNRTYELLIKELADFDMSETRYDILGEAYEEIMKDIMTGKILGQYFTPPEVKELMINLIKPKITTDGKIESCCDPAMGTGGFLINYIKYIQNDAKEKNIALDWEYIKTSIFGNEIEPNTYQLANCNMFISSGHIYSNVHLHDSIRKPITEKFDIVLANPPFGIKGLNYDAISNESGIKHQYLPIKSSNAVSLFIQAIIYMLKVNGRACVVLPDGQDLFNKTNKSMIDVRRYLMFACDLKKIIYLPAGIFSNTSIKTCVFYFVKKKEVEDVIKVETDGKKKITYSFLSSGNYSTRKVEFCDYNLESKSICKIVEVPMVEFIGKSYSLNYSEYMKEEEKEEEEGGYEVKTLGEVCDLSIKGNINTSNRTNTGEYPFYTASVNNPQGTHNVYCFEGEEYILFIKSGGNSINPLSLSHGIGKVYFVKGKTAGNTEVVKIIIKDDSISLKYLYYYLDNIRFDIQKLAKYATNLGHIDMNKFKSIKIPIPPLDIQQQIVEKLDYIYDEVIPHTKKQIEHMKKTQEFRLGTLFKVGEKKMLGELFHCKMGKFNSNDMDGKGDVPFYSCSSNNPVGVHSTHSFDYDEYLLIICSGGSQNNLVGLNVGLGKCYYVNGKSACRANVCSLVPKTKDYNIRYINYYLNINRLYTNKKAHFTTNLGIISINDVKTIKIPIPSLEIQQQTINHVEEILEYHKSSMTAIETELAKIYALCKDIIDYYNSGNAAQTDIKPSILSELEENIIVS